MTTVLSKKVFFKVFPKTLVFFEKRRKIIHDILKVSPCSNFHVDISENGWVIRFLIFQYTGYIYVLQKFKCIF